MSLALEPMSLDLSLPWQVDEQREKAFKDILKRFLLPLLLLFIVVPFLPSIDLGFNEDEDAPIRTQVLLEPIIEPEPEPVAPKVQPKPKPVKPVTPVAQPTPAPAPAPAPEVDLKKSIAESQGLAALSSQLSAMRGAVDVTRLQNKNLTDSDAGKVAKAERARLGHKLASRSDNTVVDNKVMQGDITTLAAHEAAAVEGVSMNGMPGGSPNSHLSGQLGRRDMESIRRTLEEAKGNVYALYQKALLENPGLTGEFTFELVIEPDGSISDLTLLVSELGIMELERSILDRIKSVRFSVMDVPPTVVEYRFVFLPS